MRAIRGAAGLVGVGLVVAVASLWEVTPGSFMVFACVAAPLVALGIAVYAFTVIWVLRRRGGL